MQSWIFSIVTRSSVSHDPSEIILIYWSAAQETIPIIINVENSFAAEWFLWDAWYIFPPEFYDYLKVQINSIYLKYTYRFSVTM